MSVSPPSPPPRTPGTTSHPVWDVYDEYRTARFNVKYYCELLVRTQRTNTVVEIALASTASGSALGALPVFQGVVGVVVWQVLGSVAAVLAIAKPIANWTERVRQIEATIAGYRGLEFDLRKIEVGIREAGTYTPDLRTRFARALDRRQELTVAEINLREDVKLKRKCQDATTKELPPSAFFVPEET